jgi:hypothetical protein
MGFAERQRILEHGFPPVKRRTSSKSSPIDAPKLAAEIAKSVISFDPTVVAAFLAIYRNFAAEEGERLAG